MRLLTILLCVPLALVATAASAQDHGLRVVAVEQLPAPGHARVRVEVLDPAADTTLGATPSGGDLRVKLEDGEARISSARRAKDLGLRTHTIVAIDHSGSFKQWGWATPGWQFAEAVANSLSPGDSLALQLFSETVQGYPSRTSAKDFAQDLTAAKAAPWGVITRLNSSLIQAIDEAAQANPNGFNRIYVLTDGDEESDTYSWEDVARAAAARGVQVSVVIYPPNMRQLSKEALKKLPTLLDNLRALAGATGGQVYEHDKAKAAATNSQAKTWNDRSRNFVAVEARFCGLDRKAADNRVFVDYTPGGATRVAWSDGFGFVEWGSPELYASCDPKQGSGDPPVKPSVPKDGIPWWVWAIVGALAFLLILALILGMRRRADTTQVVVKAETPRPPPPPRVPDPVVEPRQEPPPRDPAPQPPIGDRQAQGLDWELPRTFLEVTGDSSWSKDSRYAIHKREYTIGGDASRGLDLVVKHAKVSGHHCTLQVFPRGDIWVKDADSTNGTHVDGVRLERGAKVRAEVGSEIRLGSDIHFRISRPGAVVGQKRATAFDGKPAPAEPEAAPPERPRAREPKKTRIAGAGSDAAPSPSPAPAAPRKRASKKTRIIE